MILVTFHLYHQEIIFCLYEEISKHNWQIAMLFTEHIYPH